MSTRLYPYHHDDQIQNYTGQIMRAFSGFQVKSAGVTRNGVAPMLERVPVAFGAPDRIIAAIASSEARFVNHKVPMLGIMLNGISMREEGGYMYKHSYDVVHSINGNPTSVNRRLGPPMRLEYTVDIYASSISQLFEILEQVTLAFAAGISIQKSVDVYDSNTDTKLVMESIAPTFTYPTGTQRRLITLSMTFGMDIRLSFPRSIQEEFIQTIETTVSDGEGGFSETDIVEPPEDEETGG